MIPDYKRQLVSKPTITTYKEDPVDAQVQWGGCGDPRGLLKVGALYEVHSFAVHSWHVKLWLKNINENDRGYNSVSFEWEVPWDEAKYDAMHTVQW